MIGPDIVLPPGVKITQKKQTDDDSDFGMDELSLENKPAPEQRDGQLLSLFYFIIYIYFLLVSVGILTNVKVCSDWMSRLLCHCAEGLISVFFA